MVFSGRFPDIAIQRWRSMTVSAIFDSNHNIETSLNIDFLPLVNSIQKTLETYFPSTKVCLIRHTEHLQLVEIMVAARQLSLQIQRDIISCRLLITRAPPSLGTYALGIAKIVHGEQKILIKAKFFTKEMLRPNTGL